MGNSSTTRKVLKKTQRSEKESEKKEWHGIECARSIARSEKGQNVRLISISIKGDTIYATVGITMA